MNLSKAQVAASKKVRAAAMANKPPTANRAGKSQTEGDELIVGDCRSKMAQIAAKHPGEHGPFDLIFADPPYNLGWTYDEDPTRDNLPEGRYLEFSENWIKQAARLLTPHGSMWVLIDARWQDRFCLYLRNALGGAGGLHWRNTVIWHDPFPTHTDARFQPAARFLFYFTRSAKKFTWNADAVRVPSVRDQIGDARRVHDKGIVPHDVWQVARVPGNSADRVPFEDAPPQVPAEILQRIIKACSNPGDRVFDPFTGNGTTWREARRLGRKFTGIERSAKYAEQARQWALA